MPELTADDEFFNLLRVPADDELYSADEEPEWMKSEPAETHWSAHPVPQTLAETFDAWRKSVGMPINVEETTEQKLQRLRKRKWSACYGDFKAGSRL